MGGTCSLELKQQLRAEGFDLKRVRNNDGAMVMKIFIISCSKSKFISEETNGFLYPDQLERARAFKKCYEESDDDDSLGIPIPLDKAHAKTANYVGASFPQSSRRRALQNAGHTVMLSGGIFILCLVAHTIYRRCMAPRKEPEAMDTASDSP